MATSPRRVDLRLTIPAGAPFHEVAGELAEKFAEYGGADAEAARGLARAVQASIAKARPGASIDLVMAAHERELVVTLNAGSTQKLTCPLPD
jgi:hypothetical protein